jgi:hypothetical protein
MIGWDAGRVTSIKSEPESKWDAELERRGVAAVAAALAGDGVGSGRGAEFRLSTVWPTLLADTSRIGQGAKGRGQWPGDEALPLHLLAVAHWGGKTARPKTSAIFSDVDQRGLSGGGGALCAGSARRRAA